MNTERVNISWINSTVLDMFIDPFSAQDDSEEPKDLNFTWKATKFHDKLLEFQLNFSEAIFISPDKQQDKLVINFTGPSALSLFTSNITGKEVHREYWRI